MMLAVKLAIKTIEKKVFQYNIKSPAIFILGDVVRRRVRLNDE